MAHKIRTYWKVVKGRCELETITAIEEIHDSPLFGGSPASGYRIQTTDHVFSLIFAKNKADLGDSGYLISDDDPQRFIGATLYDLYATDTSCRTVPLDESLGQVELQFFTCNTSRGTLQFTFYTSSSAYYGCSMSFYRDKELFKSYFT